MLRLTPVLVVFWVAISSAAICAEPGEKFRVWAAGDSHVPHDFKNGRLSLARAIQQSEGTLEEKEGEGPSFPWDIMVDTGDLSASQSPPTDEDGQILVHQYRALKKHYREDVYNVPGNHDGTYYDQGVGTWFQQWADPLGRHTEHSGINADLRRFPVEGTWERYKFQAGNILFLMLADRNSAPAPVGRGHSSEELRGGFPAGAVTRDTFNWWKEQVLANQDKIIVTVHHHVLRDTTTRSSYGGGKGFHGSSGGVEGSGYLYFTIENDDPDDFQYTTSTPESPGPFEVFLEEFQAKNSRAAIDLWIGGHSHGEDPEQVFEGKGLTEQRWGATFIQVSALTAYHAGRMPMSRLLTFTHGSDRLEIDLYVHDPSRHGPSYPLGWHPPASRSVVLRREFEMPPSDVRPPPPVFEESDLLLSFLETFQPRDPPGEPDPLDPVPENGELSVSNTAAWNARAEGESGILFSPTAGGLNLGYLDMEEWRNLTVSARVETSQGIDHMRVVSKDRVGEKGNFVLSFDRSGCWEFRVFEDTAGDWRRVVWKSSEINDGKPHHLAGVVDSRRKVVLLYIDGRLEAQSAWTASTLDDSDRTSLVVGADSGTGAGHAFRGTIGHVRIFHRALGEEEIAALCDADK